MASKVSVRTPARACLHDVAGRRFGFAGKVGKDALGNVARAVGVDDLAQSELKL
jgi:hypothetical protein